MIRHINSFFHRNSRWLFGIFTLIIAFAFVDFMNPAHSGGCAFGGGGNYGTVFGRGVDAKELGSMQHDLAVFYLIAYNSGINEQNAEVLFAQVARLEAAKLRGITAGDKQIAEFLRALPRFQKNGAFDPALYDAFLKTLAEQRGLGQADIDRACRTVLTLNALDAEIAAGVVITDDELANFHRILNEKFTVRRAEFKGADYKKKVELASDELAKFFESHKKSYRIPAKAKVLVAVFANSDPARFEAAKKAAVPEELKRFYESNSVLFMKPGKEGSSLPPYAEVEAKVKSEFLKRKCADLALAEARDFARKVYNDNEEDAVGAFRAVAAKNKVKFAEAGTVSAADVKIGNVELPALVKSLFDHIGTVPVSDAVSGPDGAYVAVAGDIERERQAEFNEVKNRVIADYRTFHAVAAARKAAKAVRDKYTALDAAAAGKAVAADMMFAAVPVFTPAAPPADPLGSYTALAARATMPGTVSELVELPEGALLVFVENRSSDAAPKEFDPVLRAGYRMLKRQAAEMEFSRYLQTQCKYFQQK